MSFLDDAREEFAEPTPERAPRVPDPFAGDPFTGGWAETALANELDTLRSETEGSRNAALNTAAFNLGQIVAGGGLDYIAVAEALTIVAREIGLDTAEIAPTIRSGLKSGEQHPRTAPERPDTGGTSWLDSSSATGSASTSGGPTASTTSGSPDAAGGAATLADETAEQAPKRLRDGGSFILDAPDKVPCLWGDDTDVIWARGEALMIVGPPGVGKTTLVGQVLRARLGLGGDVLGYPVEVTESRVLYLAMDRPQQIARALRRTFKASERAQLDDLLRVWEGPPPADIAKRPDILLKLAQVAGADTVMIDSLKDAAIGLGEDEVAGGYNRARQMCLASGVQVLELHHLVKRGPNGSKPNTLADVYGSAWLTAGAGSVVLLWGSAGDLVVELGHLKQPSGEVGPFRVVHDHDLGLTTIEHAADLLVLARLSPPTIGLTAHAAAIAIFGAAEPTRSDIEKARRRLEKLVGKNLLVRVEGRTGGAAGSHPTGYRPVTPAVTASPWE